jgi:hypothetical protein
MKKTLFILLLFCNYANAQITISGSSIAGINQTFAFASSGAFHSTCAGGLTPNDVGANIYAVNDPAFSSNSLRYTIVRRAGYWHIEGHYGSGAYLIYYKSLSPSTDPNPPCNITWGIYTGNCYYGYGITYTGTNTSTLLLSGTCVSVPMVSATICPNVVQLPQQTTAQVSAIASPQKGMIVFDVSANVLKVFNGAVWKTISML